MVSNSTSASADITSNCGGITAPSYSCADGTLHVDVGGTVCGKYLHSTENLRSCANKANNYMNYGSRCSGCDRVRLYYGYSYSGAYFCVLPGQQILTSAGDPPTYKFNRGGSGSAGYGLPIYRNVASIKWVGSSC
jgi:hypothetical protein